MNRASSRLAARLGIRQVLTHERAAHAAEQADAAIRQVWNQVLALLKRRPSWVLAHHEATAIFAGLFRSVVGYTAAHLRQTARWGHRTAAAAYGELPKRLLDYAAAKKTIAGNPAIPDALPSLLSESRLTEAYTPTVSDLLFPRLSDDLIDRIVYGRMADGTSWIDRLAGATRLATPGRLAEVLVGGLAAGKSQAEVARDLLPAVNGVRSTAKRIARTETMRVAAAGQDACAVQLGELQQGWQIHSTLGPHSRPWHQARNGTIYWFHPKPGAKGLLQCPNPPDEAPDVNERPIINGKRAPAVAFNCLCYRTPVLSEPNNAASVPRASTPDPLVFGDWFSGQTEDRRRRTIGSRRYSLMQDLLQHNPEWEDFLDPETWQLMTREQLAAETPIKRAVRATVVHQELAKRRALLQQTSAVGFVQ